MKRIANLFCSLLIALVSLLSLAPAKAAGVNLVANPSVEQGTTAPSSWTKNKWGTNAATFTYVTNEGHTGTRSVKTTMTSRSSGDAKWYFNAVNVTPGQTYTFSDYYKSSVATDVTVEVQNTSGALSYYWLGSPAASTSAWQSFAKDFTMPAGAAKATVFHTIGRVGTLQIDDAFFGLKDATPPPAPVAPTAQVTAPTTGATVSGTQTLTATAASSGAAVAGVQFKVDGANVGAEDLAAPYSTSWDTASTSNGAHNITATARSTNGLSTTSSTVQVTVNNTVTPPPVDPPTASNLIPNPSVEAVSGTLPQSWMSNSWGTNTASLSHESTGHTGSRSVKATLSSYTSGDAKWYFNSIPVTAGKTYDYSNWYKSSVTTELNAMVTMSNGSVQYYWLGDAAASPSTWTKANAQFTAPSGAAKVTIFQVISSVGYVQTDDFSLAEYQPAKFGRALVSLTFDDGWRSIYTNGLPLLNQYGFVSTQYLNSEPIMGDYPDYMTYQQVKDFIAAGHEVGWHTRTHADLTGLSTSAMTAELTIPSTFLSGVGQPASSFKNFASPFGAYNNTTVTETMKHYRSHRSTDVGYNARSNFNIQNIKVQNITSTTTAADVQAWVNQAIATNSWLVIVYHEVGTSNEDPTYSTTPALMNQHLNVIKQSGVTVKTVDQALGELIPQL